MLEQSSRSFKSFSSCCTSGIIAASDWLTSSNHFTVLCLSFKNPRMLSLVRCDLSGLTKVAPCALDSCALSSFVGIIRHTGGPLPLHCLFA
jgi:hypothetical protein